MKEKELFAILLISFLYACNSSSKNAEAQKQSSVLIDRSIIDSKNELSYYDSLLKASDQRCLTATVDSIMLPDTYSESVYVLLHSSNHVPIKLKYPVFSDGGIRDGYGEYYFDQNGKLFANRVESLIKIFNEIDTIISFKNTKGILKKRPLSLIGKLSKLALASREVADYMQFFPDVKYMETEAYPSSIPILKTKSVEIDLKASPNKESKTLKVLSKRSRLVFLGSTQHPDLINNKSWIWYRVINDEKIEGWIFGHPSFVGDLNDENFNE